MLEFYEGDLDLQNQQRCQTLLSLFHLYTLDTEKDAFDRKTRLKSTLVLVEDNTDSYFNFSPGLYSPEVHGLDKALHRLKELNLITTGTTTTPEITYEWYKLTPEGRQTAILNFSNMEPEKQELLNWIIEKHTKRDMGALLSFCYQQAPHLYQTQ